MTKRAAELLARPAVVAVLATLSDGTDGARVVGGAVRDIVMGLAPGDVDIATQLHPQEVMARSASAGWKSVPTGLAHGTVTVVVAGQPFEVTTLRRDEATDGRRATVAFTTDFREDAARRDFTFNALSLSADGTVHDYATGVADARAGRVRFMGDPAKRISEDYLRILRFFRFQASHGKGPPDADALAACAALKAGLAQLSRERIRQELLKLLLAPGAADAVDGMAEIGLWTFILPGTPINSAAFRHWALLGPCFRSLPEPMSALAALVGCGASAAGVADSLRLSRQQAALLSNILQHGAACAGPAMAGGEMRRCVYLAGAGTYPAALRAGAAWAKLDMDTVVRLLQISAPVLSDPPRLPFRSGDVAAAGIPAGPAMGAALARAEQLWLEAGLPSGRQAIAGILGQAIGMPKD